VEGASDLDAVDLGLPLLERERKAEGRLPRPEARTRSHANIPPSRIITMANSLATAADMPGEFNKPRHRCRELQVGDAATNAACAHNAYSNHCTQDTSAHHSIAHTRR
jgi:hypothetical protein